MPGADLLFLPLPFAHAARGNGAGPTNGVECHVDPADATAESETVIAALRRIVAAGDAAARTTLLSSAPGRVTVDADAWHAYRAATIAAGLEMYPL